MEQESYNQEKVKRALLAGVCTGREHEFQISMDELAELARSCGMEPVRRVTQNLPWTDKATCAGPGKVEEIRMLAEAEEADLVIFNNNLSPAQISNLTKLLDVEVLDRTALILQIFTERARTREARLQVEYARLQYMLPRLVGMRRNLSRQGGGSGALSNKGSGEMQIELDRRHIERRMSVLRKELEKVSRSRETQRKMRLRNNLPLVSLVGYTNAGKSTLMNALIDYCDMDESSRHVFVKDMVFATLDTAVRRIEPEGAQPFLLSDTVGFINDLPTFLVEAFHSTLEEVLQADLILNVVDASDPEHDMHMEVTSRTLSELGAGSIPIIQVMNKADLLPGSNQAINRADLLPGSNQAMDKADLLPGSNQAMDRADLLPGSNQVINREDLAGEQHAAGIAALSNEMERSSPGAKSVVHRHGNSDRIWLSARSNDGIGELISLIEEKLNGDTAQVTVMIPYADMSMSEPLRKNAVVLSEEYTQDGLKMEARMDMDMLRKCREYIV